MHHRSIQILLFLLAIVVTGYLIPDKTVIPVQAASKKDWNRSSFWFEPWGQSGVHKGIDIFAKQGQPVISASSGLVIYQGQLGIGGNVIAILGPKWRIHYYAHLAEPTAAPWFVASGERIGSVGTSGNAAGKAPHLHYAILSLIPLPWRYSQATQGWRQIYYLNPDEVLAGGS
ncbi:M23 family metallopeptidase [Undibacterium crateris]|uniref:M23 family metallopeptidase n=1 Tax=Undibacterium crateris TaxID=2528175 RepID=UPI001389DB58|nr:M23 family metallopeptidase [Undibacterium crateris]NDI84169.1 peptidoglycan DD-metalloendopeptidase family protein [Undibacterium crateris]